MSGMLHPAVVARARSGAPVVETRAGPRSGGASSTQHHHVVHQRGQAVGTWSRASATSSLEPLHRPRAAPRRRLRPSRPAAGGRAGGASHRTPGCRTVAGTVRRRGPDPVASTGADRAPASARPLLRGLNRTSGRRSLVRRQPAAHPRRRRLGQDPGAHPPHRAPLDDRHARPRRGSWRSPSPARRRASCATVSAASGCATASTPAPSTAIAYAQLRQRWEERGVRPPELLDRKVGFVAAPHARRAQLAPLPLDVVAEIEWASARLVDPEAYAGCRPPGPSTTAARAQHEVAEIYDRYATEKRRAPSGRLRRPAPPGRPRPGSRPGVRARPGAGASGTCSSTSSRT